MNDVGRVGRVSQLKAVVRIAQKAIFSWPNVARIYRFVSPARQKLDVLLLALDRFKATGSPDLGL